MSGCHSKNSEQMHSPLKTILKKITDRYQAYCTTYKMHSMATCHGGAGCPIDRDIEPHLVDTEGINTGPDNDNESTSGSNTTVGFRGSVADGHSSELIPSSQAKLTALKGEINDLPQCVEAGEGQPAERLDHREWGLQNLSLALHPQPTSIPTPTGHHCLQ